METVLSIVTSLLMAVTGAGGAQLAADAPSSSELGLAELSPAGEAGGFAMPASGCSYTHGSGASSYVHECDPNPPQVGSRDPIIRSGDTTTINWDPNGHINCVLLGNLANQGPVTEAGSEDVSPVADTTYMIMCDDDGDGDPEAIEEITVRVLPRIQET